MCVRYLVQPGYRPLQLLLPNSVSVQCTLYSNELQDLVLAFLLQILEQDTTVNNRALHF